ncbi:MAG: hypothetical protein ACRBHB_03665 [Arenicella sp.]
MKKHINTAKNQDLTNEKRRKVVKHLLLGASGISFIPLSNAQANNQGIAGAINLLLNDEPELPLDTPIVFSPTSPNQAQHIKVPSGANYMHYSVKGAGGGGSTNSHSGDGADGGNGGAVIQEDFDLSGIDELFIHVGEGGHPDGTPGEFGGGAGGTVPDNAFQTSGGAGGGGYAAIMNNENTAIALAGGGGGGGGTCRSNRGGAGGTSTSNFEGGDAESGFPNLLVAGSGGQGADVGGEKATASTTASDGADGMTLQGGSGGNNPTADETFSGGAGGGGGGGFVGGGGGGAGGGNNTEGAVFGGGGGGGGGGLNVVQELANANIMDGASGGDGAAESSQGTAGGAGSVSITFSATMAP